MDVEYPGSALPEHHTSSTTKHAKDCLDANGLRQIQISTNIAEDQPRQSTACQAALGVAVACE